MMKEKFSKKQTKKRRKRTIKAVGTKETESVKEK